MKSHINRRYTVGLAAPRACSLGHNDLWIAATAAATGAHLITTDTDFDPLHPDHIRCTVLSES